MALALLGVGAAVTVAFMLDAGEPQEPSWWRDVLPFAAWALLPYLVVGLLTFRLQRFPASLRVLVVGAGLLTASSSGILYAVFVVHPDAQDGLIFLFLPLYQLVGLIPIGLLAGALRARRGPTGGRDAP